MANDAGYYCGKHRDRNSDRLGRQRTPNYTAFCVKCHGPTGHGDGPAAASLATKARDYTDCVTMHKITDETLFKAIKSGGAAVGLPTDMPSWGNGLSDQEITGLVKFVRGFCKK